MPASGFLKMVKKPAKFQSAVSMCQFLSPGTLLQSITIVRPHGYAGRPIRQVHQIGRLQCVEVGCSVSGGCICGIYSQIHPRVAVCCSVSQIHPRVAVCCSVSQIHPCVEVGCSVLGGCICWYSVDPCHVLQCVAVCRSDLESVELLTPQRHGAGEDKCIYIYLTR